MKIKNQAHGWKMVRPAPLMAILVAGAIALVACDGNPTASPPGSVATTAGSSTGSVVLPVTDNPIKNTSTVKALKIDSVLVENNVDSAGKDTSDHLEIALTNTGSSDLSGFEVFYTFTDPTTNTTESYYAKLPDSFTIPAGGKRIVDFDNTGVADHFPVNQFSLYYTSAKALEVTVTVGAVDAATQTATTQKDAGGEEGSD